MHKLFLFADEDFKRWFYPNLDEGVIFNSNHIPVKFPCILIWTRYEKEDHVIVEHDFIYENEFKESY